MTENVFQAEKGKRIGILREWLIKAKSEGRIIDLKRLKAVFMADYGILPSLLDRYLVELESAGIIRINRPIQTIDVL